MRLPTIFVLIIMLFLAVSAAAESYKDNCPATDSLKPKPAEIDIHGPATLRLSPMAMEIRSTLEKAGETKDKLLQELVAAEDYATADRIIRYIKRLEMQTDLDVLTIQIKYARKTGRWDREKNLKAEVVALLEKGNH